MRDFEANVDAKQIFDVQRESMMPPEQRQSYAAVPSQFLMRREASLPIFVF
jgi:hypothetical protein